MTPTEFMREYLNLARTRDIEALLALIDDDAVFLFSNQSSHFGKDAIQSAICANFEAIQNEDYGISDLTWLVSSDEVAVCVYEFAWVGEIDGAPAAGGGRGTTAVRHVADAGRAPWRVVHE
ncbi:MAG: nuclear transport factor 2 family protein, partial [Methylocystis sp.]